MTTYDYIGTGGAIVDVGVFYYELFWQCPVEFRNMEDMWLSFIAREHLGFSLERYGLPVNDVQTCTCECKKFL